MFSRIFTQAAVCVGLTALLLAAGGAAPSAADAQGNASCVGFEASNISPPGSLEEFPGGAPELVAVLHDAVGNPIGAAVSDVAQLHLGSHEACDAAE